MFRKHLKDKRAISTDGICAMAMRLICALILAVALPVAASAYTVIMRSGRRVEIPATFIVTGGTLTYEAAPGINVTLQLANIDIAATEQANGETPGSLLRRAGEQRRREPKTQESSTAPQTARRTLTNQDVNKSRRARKVSESAYERRRGELGLPSPEESQRRMEEEAKSIREMGRQWEMERSQSEAYWRARATELRTEMSVLNAEINYLRARLAETNDIFSPNAFVFITGYNPIFPFRPFFPGRPRLPGNAHGTGINIGAHPIGRIVGNDRMPAGVPLQGRHPSGFFPRRIIAPPHAFVPNITALALPFSYSTDDRYALITRLQALEAQRAGLEARWRLLEDEARRAGALPGWLRP